MQRYRGIILHKYGLVRGPHPEKCDCCRSVRLEVFKRIQRRLKRNRCKRESRRMIIEEAVETPTLEETYPVLVNADDFYNDNYKFNYSL